MIHVHLNPLAVSIILKVIVGSGCALDVAVASSSVAFGVVPVWASQRESQREKF